MPKLFRNLLFIVFIFNFFRIANSTALASSDPQSATVSATATVPTTTPTSDTTPPTNPILISPADGTHTSDNTPEFVWTQSTDPNGNYVYYTFYLNGVATFLGISNTGNSAGTGYTSRIDGGQIKLTPTAALGDGHYSWHVTARDGSGNTSSSTTWGFTVDTVAPPLTLVDLESYHYPPITEGANFDLDGPLDVNFTILSDPNISIQINISGSGSFQLASQTLPSGHAYLDKYLAVGTYTITILAVDLAGNTTFLPDFTLTIHQAAVAISLPPLTPGASPTPIITIPYTPINLISLPATIANIQARLPLLLALLALLALALLVLLIFLWGRRYNLILLDHAGSPVKRATIYHSIPTSAPSNAPVLYELKEENLGKKYIHHLSRYSTLTVRVEDVTYVFSICAKLKVYTIILG